MALKLSAVLFVFVLVVAAMAVAPVAQAQRGFIRELLDLIRIQGTLFCTADGNISENDSSTAVFPSAPVQLRCRNDTVVSTSTTNGQGRFSMLFDPLQFLVSILLSNCKLVVNTPLSTCNSTLPALGTLFSPLQFFDNSRIGLVRITNIGPIGFRFG